MTKFTLYFWLGIISISGAQHMIEHGIIQGFASEHKEIIFTFDACESETPAIFDERILSVIIKEKLPCIIFLGGKFAIRNRERIKELCRYNFIEFGNHSFSHKQHMERLSAEEQVKEVNTADSVIKSVTSKKPKFFRFPGGNYDTKSVSIVKQLGYKILHWTFASGDPDKSITAARLQEWVKLKTKPGSVLIFHINQRGYKTGESLPSIIQFFRAKGMVFKKPSEIFN